MKTPHRWEPEQIIFLRSAGFPQDLLLSLHSPSLAELADQVATHVAVMQQLTGPLLGAIAERRRNADEPALVNRLRRAERAVRRLAVVADPSALPMDTMTPWNRLAVSLARTMSQGRESWPEEEERLNIQLRQVVADSGFLEAVFANSPSAYDGMGHLLRGGNRKKERYAARVAVKYLASFTGKCETGGIHGPINFIRSVEGLDGVELVSSGDGRSATRRVFLTQWMLQALLTKSIGSEGTPLFLRMYRRADIEATSEGAGLHGDLKRLWLKGSGTPVSDVFTELGIEVDAGVGLIRELIARGLITLGLRLPAYSLDPLDGVFQIVSREETETYLREAWGDIDWFDTWTRTMEEDVPLVERVTHLESAERRFESRTQLAPRRGESKFGADRFIYWEESSGNIRGEIGESWLRKVVDALSLSLDILASEAVRARLRAHVRLNEALPRTGRLPAESLSRLEAPDYGTSETQWHNAIPDPSVSVVQLDEAACRSAGLLTPDSAAWPLFCAPDVMFAADGMGALSQGDYLLVLSEVHHILPSLSLPMRSLNPFDGGAASRTVERLQQLVAPFVPAMYAEERTDKGMDLTPNGCVVVCLDWLRNEGGALASVPLSDLEFGRGPGGRPTAFLTGTDTPLAFIPQYPDVEPSGGVLRHLALPALDKRPVVMGSHTPRIMIDGVVFQRERWDLGGDDLAGLPKAAKGFDDLVAVTRWRHERRIPREVFVHIPGQDKPMLTHFDAPFLLDVLLRESAKIGNLALTEALPASDKLWLRHATGRVPCEFRFACFRTGR